MERIKVAVLEDHKEFLKEMLDNLKRTGLVDVVVAEQASEPFIQRVREEKVEILLLDIRLAGETATGVDVAKMLKLPVIFMSGARSEFLDSIDSLKISKTFPPVEEVGKIPNADELEVLIKKFIPRLREYQKSVRVKVKPINSDEEYINPNEVSFILASNGNHILYFTHRNSIEVADRSFNHFIENGFSASRFYLFGRNYLLNIELTRLVNDELLIDYKFGGTMKTERLPVPPEKRRKIKEVFKR
jgi:hypothetical protein